MKEEALLNTEEDARFGEPLRGDELPEELRRREDRLAAIVAAKERAAQREADDARGRRPEWERHPKGGQPYKRAYGEPEDKAQNNFTDPDSAIMKTGAEGFQQCYNAQVAGRASVDCCDGADDRGAGLRGQGDLRRAARDGAWPATAMNGTCRHLKRAASTWRRGARARGR